MIRTPICLSVALVFSPCISAASNPVLFTDVTESSGVTFFHRTGAKGGWHYIEPMGSGCALFDYDGDGDLDLYLINAANLPGQPLEGINALYCNDTTADGKIRFTDVTQQAGVPGRGYGMGCTVGDYDNDGDIDLYVTGYEENILYRNNGDGTFTDVTQQAGLAGGGWSTSAAFFDYDGDGDLDLYVVRYLIYDTAREPTCYKGGVRIYCSPLNFPGMPDLLFRNNGDGTFTDVTQQAGIAVYPPGKGLGVVTFDYDSDGDTDLYVANDTTPNFLYRNDGGTFTEIGVAAGVATSASGKSQSGMGVDAGDINGDGAPDLIVTNFSLETNALYRNGGSGLFAEATAEVGLFGPSTMPMGWGTHFFDFDNDGDLDLFVANGHLFPNVAVFSPTESYAQPDQLFRNDGGTFEDITGEASFTGPTVGRGSAVGDLDGDGDLDLVVMILGGRPQIYRNDGRNWNHWLMVKLVGGTRGVQSPESRVQSHPERRWVGDSGPGTRDPGLSLSNRNGIGARVTVWVGGRQQVREVRSGSSYLSASDLRLHFGLGAEERVERIEVHWPSGRMQVLSDVQADRVVVLEEGKEP